MGGTVGGLLIVAALVGCAGEPNISVTDAVVPIPANPSEASVYLRIENSGSGDDELLSVTSDVADMTHLHETNISDDGLASMTSLNTVIIPGGETVEFVPGDLHVMLMRPRTLEEGEKVPITMKFKESGVMVVEATVVSSIADVLDQ